jgi:6-pyruvoyltetrahydropterin/6-carboxytetrahydropterin synthase|tara:strand:+ start:9476 stop:9925 length:450 start_codon:yes stop_codon:yes gene_type:complete
MKTYQVIKTFGTDRGFSCAFRQWKADSACNQIHGYSLGFKLTLEAADLDDKSWVYDFGGFINIKNWIEDHFDHTFLISKDDPELELLKELGNKGVANIIELDAVGCEKFAEMTYNFSNQYINEQTNGRVKLLSVEVFEHGANSAVFKNT